MKIKLFLSLSIALTATAAITYAPAPSTGGTSYSFGTGLVVTGTTNITAQSSNLFAITAGGTISTNLLVKKGADSTHVIACSAASDIPCGIFAGASTANNGDAINLRVLDGGIALLKLGGSVALGDLLCTDSAGKAQKLPVISGTYYIIGQALTNGASGDVIPVTTGLPVQRIVP